MHTPAPSRRTILKSAAGAAVASTRPRFSIGRPSPSAGRAINVACIGIGNRGFYAVSELMTDPRVSLMACLSARDGWKV